MLLRGGTISMRRLRRSCLAALMALLVVATAALAQRSTLLHPKYHLPAAAFAYVGDAADPATWKLPYRQGDGSVDRKRLPLAVAAVLETYRGRQVRIPGGARHEVLETLGRAADEIGKLPPRAKHPAAIYRKLAAALGRSG
jgi:hypothetical protein